MSRCGRARSRTWLELRRFRRTASLSDLQKPLEDVCAWCNRNGVPKRRKYCTQECADSAHRHCYPQSPAAKMYAFVQLQDCVCLLCGEWFVDAVKELVDKAHAWNLRCREQGYEWASKDEQVTLWEIGNGTGDRWEVDHIIPLFRGGIGIGFDNIQVVCKGCHRKKTTEER